MVSCIVQSIAVMLGFGATLLTIAIYAMPHWRMSVIVEASNYGRRLDGNWIGRWDGLWMSCVRQNNNPMACQTYTQSMTMPLDLKVSRILISFAIIAALSGCACSLFGMLYNQLCFTNKKNGRCFLLLAGMCLLSAGLLVLIPAALIAINTLRDICYSNCKNVQHQEIGEAIMLAWPTVMLFFIGGSIFCWYHPCVCSEKSCICPSEENQHDMCDEGNNLEHELYVFTPGRRHNQDIVL